MSSLGSRLWSRVAVLAGVCLVLTTMSPAEAATSRSVNVVASPKAAVVGTAVTFSGKLTKSPTGSVVRIQRKAGSRWVFAKSTRTTTSLGAYAVKVALPSRAASYAFRAYAPAKGSLRAATSKTIKVAALRRVSAVIKASPSTVNLNQLTVVTGTVKPFVAGSLVTLQGFNGASWTTVTTAVLSNNGTFTRFIRPTATTSYRLVVPRRGLNASVISSAVKVTVTGGPVAPTITTSSLPNGTLGVAYSGQLTKNGDAGTWAKTTGSLPGGVSLNASSGALSGTPTAAGTFNFTVSFTETGSGLSASKALSIAIAAAPVITTTTLPDGTRGSAYSTTLTKTGAAGTWAATGLPTGLTLAAGTGVLSGTPTQSGDFALNVSFTETASGLVAHKALALHLAAPPDPVITTTSVPDGTKGTAYSQTLTKTGNAGNWAVTAGTLPAGVTLSSAGVLSGTPTVTGDFGFTVTFTETAAQTSDTQGLLLHVSAPGAPVINTSSLPDGKVGTAYSAQLDGSGVGTWSITFGTLPAGITLNGFTGALSGTPTTVGDSFFIVKYQTLSGSNTKVLSIHVNP